MEPRLPPCMGLSHKQIWDQFLPIYQAKGLTEYELKVIHRRWVLARAYAEGRR